MISWFQKQIILAPRTQGIHLITDDLASQLPEIRRLRVGMANFFIQHTSASLAINENADPEVRVDLEKHLDLLAPADAPHYTHTYEGPDDMPAHIKAVLTGSTVEVPITDGQLNLGVWQGIYLCEHRLRAGPRKIVVTLWGATKA